MARRRRQRKPVAPLAVTAIVILLAFQLIQGRQWWILTQIGTVSLALLGLWLLFYRSTRCGYITHQGQPCRIQAHGELRGCKKYHKGLKAQALLNHIGLKHPRQWMQRAWMEKDDGTEKPEESPPGKLERPVYDISMLIATFVSAAAAIVMPLIQTAMS